jgi:hypothetical protein
MRRIFDAIALLIIFVAFCVLCLIGYWLIYPYNPIVIKTQPIQVYPTTVKGGDYIGLRIDYCKYMALPATVMQRFQDDLIYVKPNYQTNNPTGCHSTITTTQIPQELPPATYTITQTYTYQVNPLRMITVTNQTIPFKVVQ